jgi:hypothetical protein
MNALVPTAFTGTAISSRFANVKAENDLAANIQGGFSILGYRGKVWSTRYRGEEVQLMRDDGDGPRGSVEVVIVKASPSISKIFYKAGWVEGSSAPPDCFSTNGVTPDAGVQLKECTTCAACPKNAWGSRITPAGKQGKACSDSRRLAVVPLLDIKNEMLGGPMLLRVPAASLQEFAQYGDRMGKMGYPYYSIGTRIAFDAKESYPKFVVNEVRPLSDAEADLVVALREDPVVARILAEGSEHDAGVAPETPNFEQPKPVDPVPAMTPAATPSSDPIQRVIAAADERKAATGGFGGAPQPAEPVETVPTQLPTGGVDTAPPAGTSFEDDIDAKMAALMPA